MTLTESVFGQRCPKGFQKQLLIRVESSMVGCPLIEANSWVVWTIGTIKGGNISEVVLLNLLLV